VSNGDFGSGFTFDPSVFFGAIIDTIVAVINAIIAALVYLYNLLLTIANYLYRALVAVANFLVNVTKLVVRGLVHIISDFIHGRFVHLFQDFIDLKNKLTQWLAPVLRILQTLRRIFNVYVLQPTLRMINLIQRMRQFLVVFRLLGFKWAARLDNYLTKVEQKIITNTLVLQAYLNLAISVLDLIVDPSLILRKNVLLASLVAALGVIKRVVFFGANRTLSTDEKKTQAQETQALAPHTQLLQSGFADSAVYYPTVTNINTTMNGMLANYAAKGTLA
jgi:hypothetical protein